MGRTDGGLSPLVSTTRQAGHMAKRKVGVEFSQSMLEPVRPGAASADRAKGVVLIDLESLQHFLIVHKTPLSLPK